MDYLFMLELNGQSADLNAVKQRIIAEPNGGIPYLEIDERITGLVGIVKFAAGKDTDRDNFFEKIRIEVRDINHLPPAKADFGKLEPEDVPDNPATWARASMGEVLDGFQPEGVPDRNSDENPYQIVAKLIPTPIPTLKGGIGGKR